MSFKFNVVISRVADVPLMTVPLRILVRAVSVMRVPLNLCQVGDTSNELLLTHLNEALDPAVNFSNVGPLITVEIRV